MFRSLFYSAAVGALICMPFVQADEAEFKSFVAKYQDNTKSDLASTYGQCTYDNAARRREWSDLDQQARLEYIDAVLCLHELPSKIDPAKAPGARNRYDDFGATHIINTPTIHATGSFFAWHRWFVYLYETALREECGYSGYQPYWDWPRWVDLPIESNPLYDGSSTSMSGNGAYIPNRNGTLQPFPIPDVQPGQAIYTAPGTGGGYVQEGPFVNWTLHLGPYYNQTVENGIDVPENPGPNGLGYNPRPLIRDFNQTLIQASNSYDVLTKFLNYDSIHTFQPDFFTGPHLGGHLFISGVDNDLFTSPGDPLFWFHHAQIDRIWSIWQAQDFATRTTELDGTLTILNDPASRNATLDDPMVFDFSPDITIRQGQSPTKGGMCYFYE